MDHTELLNAAIAWHGAAVTCLPVRTDGSKAPALQWKNYQQRHPTLDELVGWFGGADYDGIGVLTGQVSGNLEMVELEGRAIHVGALTRLREYATDNGAGDMLDRVMAGYTECTPSGGLHLLYRLSDGLARRNTKLARTTAREVLAETRGEGGFVVVAPSFGRSHPTGTPWVIDSGGIATIAVITSDERDLLWAIFGMLDEEQPTEQHFTATGLLATGSTPGTRPGDEYDAKTSWEQILIPLGWAINRPMGRGYAWTRPGKDHGISATTGQSNDGVDRLFVFSSSTEFETEKAYTKFAAYTHLSHGGDFSAAARDLGSQGYGSPAQMSTSATSAGTSTGAATTGTMTLAPAPTLLQSEDGYSQLVISEHGATVRYCSERGRWLHWNGSSWVWQPAGGGFIKELAKSVARQMPQTSGPELSHKKRCSSSAGVASALILASTDFRVAVSIEQLDAKPWELNTPGGIINLRTGELIASDPGKLHTRSTLTTPDFTADQSVWRGFLDTTFQSDQVMIDWIQRLMGYACVGTVREAILPVFYGEGANGKTVLLETVQKILGDYATVAPAKFLVQGMAQHATEIAALSGARLVIASETNEGERFDEAKVKILTGGDSIKARFMRQDEFTFTPSHLLIMMTNHRPEVGSGGTSFWRRVREVPFNHYLPPETRDPEMSEKLIANHAPSIMAWLAQGAAMYAATGLKEPPAVMAATSVYEASTDSVARFVDDICLIGGGEFVKIQTAKVRSAYEEWCREEGDTPISPKGLTQQLTTRFGAGKGRENRSRFYTNLSLIEGPDSE